MIGDKIGFQKTKQAISGFSLIEIVVSVSLFSVAMIISTTIFKNVLEGQRNTIGAQNTQENLRYMAEMISKEIRSAKKLASRNECDATLALTGFAANSVNKIFNTADSKRVLYFKNKNGECVAYYLNNSQLWVIHDSPPYGNIAGSLSDYQASSTPNEIIISNLNFQDIDDPFDAFHEVQPQVIIRMTAENKTVKNSDKQKIEFQTTVSSRYYQ